MGNLAWVSLQDVHWCTRPLNRGTMTRPFALLLVLAVAAAAACAKPKDTAANNRDTMTKRQRDSVLGQSGLPGAQGITKAMRAADSVKAQTARLDSITP